MGGLYVSLQTVRSRITAPDVYHMITAVCVMNLLFIARKHLQGRLDGGNAMRSLNHNDMHEILWERERNALFFESLSSWILTSGLVYECDSIKKSNKCCGMKKLTFLYRMNVRRTRTTQNKRQSPVNIWDLDNPLEIQKSFIF